MKDTFWGLAFDIVDFSAVANRISCISYTLIFSYISAPFFQLNTSLLYCCRFLLFTLHHSPSSPAGGVLLTEDLLFALVPVSLNIYYFTILFQFYLTSERDNSVSFFFPLTNLTQHDDNGQQRL